MLRIGDEVQPFAVDDQQRARIVVVEEARVRLRKAPQVVLADSGFDVKGYTPKVEAALPQAYKLDSKGRVVRKG